MRIEQHNVDGTGARRCEVYPRPAADDYWSAVTNCPCPVQGCQQTVVWYEAGYAPGYRVCMASLGDGKFDRDTLRHRFHAGGNGNAPTLIRVDASPAPSIAERIAERFDGEWTDAEGFELQTVLDDLCYRPAYRNRSVADEPIRYEFPDASAIVLAGVAWDVGFSGEDLACFCWPDANHGRHVDDCPENADTGGDQ